MVQNFTFSSQQLIHKISSNQSHSDPFHFDHILTPFISFEVFSVYELAFDPLPEATYRTAEAVRATR